MQKHIVKRIKKGTALVTALALTVSGFTFSNIKAASKAPTLSDSKITIKKGNSKNISIIKKKNVTIKKVTWNIDSGKKVVKLTKETKTYATIKALKKGTAEISAKIKVGKKTYTRILNITVKASTQKTKTPATKIPATATPFVTKTPTQTPAVTKAPTKAPVVTEAPTKIPVVTEAPTKTPVVTEAPTETPVVTEAPTETPVVTEAPTKAPVVTEAPTVTNGPIVTYLPMLTNPPSITKAPVETPKVTEAPKEPVLPDGTHLVDLSNMTSYDAEKGGVYVSTLGATAWGQAFGKFGANSGLTDKKFSSVIVDLDFYKDGAKLDSISDWSQRVQVIVASNSSWGTAANQEATNSNVANGQTTLSGTDMVANAIIFQWKKAEAEITEYDAFLIKSIKLVEAPASEEPEATPTPEPFASVELAAAQWTPVGEATYIVGENCPTGFDIAFTATEGSNINLEISTADGKKCNYGVGTGRTKSCDLSTTQWGGNPVGTSVTSGSAITIKALASGEYEVANFAFTSITPTGGEFEPMDLSGISPYEYTGTTSDYQKVFISSAIDSSLSGTLADYSKIVIDYENNTGKNLNFSIVAGDNETDAFVKYVPGSGSFDIMLDSKNFNAPGEWQKVYNSLDEAQALSAADVRLKVTAEAAGTKGSFVIKSVSFVK